MLQASAFSWLGQFWVSAHPVAGSPSCPPSPHSATWTSPSTWTSRASCASCPAPPTTGCAETTLGPPTPAEPALHRPRGCGVLRWFWGSSFLPQKGVLGAWVWEGGGRGRAHRDCVFHNLCFYMVAFTPINPQLGRLGFLGEGGWHPPHRCWSANDRRPLFSRVSTGSLVSSSSLMRSFYRLLCCQLAP